MLSRTIIIVTSFVLVAMLTYLLPNAVVAVAKSIDMVSNWLAEAAGVTGYWRLLLEFGNVGLTLLLALTTFVVGFLWRRVSARYFRWSKVATATLLPLIAHVLKWGLALWWPLLLLPLYNLTEWVIHQLGPTWQVRVAALGGRDLIENLILCLAIITAWRGLHYLLWRLFRRQRPVAVQPPEQTPPSGGSWRRKMRKFFKKSGGAATKSKALQIKKRGWYLGPLSWNYLFRPIVSLLTATLVVLIFVLADSLLEIGIFANPWVAILATLLLAVLIGFDDMEQEVVPPGYCAVTTFLGMPIRIYRANGHYRWQGLSVGFGRTDVIRRKKAGDETSGYLEGTTGPYISVEEFPIEIWNKSTDMETTLVSLGKDGSEVRATLQLNVQLMDPVKYVKIDKPVLILAERARTAFRTAISFFTARDNAGLKSILTQLMSGRGILASYLQQNASGHKRGSVARDTGDVAVFELYDDRDGDEAYPSKEVAEAKLRNRLDQSTSDETQQKIRGRDGNFDIENHSVEASLHEALATIGARLNSASVGQIEFSQTVQENADKAASEEWQYDAQTSSAQAAVASQKIIRDGQPTEPGPMDELALMLTAAQDNPEAVKVIYTPAGSNSLLAAAVAAATELKGAKK